MNSSRRAQSWRRYFAFGAAACAAGFVFVLAHQVDFDAADVARPRIVAAAAPVTAAPAAPRPRAFRVRGHLICLAEEMQQRFGAQVQPVHEHLFGFRSSPSQRESRDDYEYHTIVRTAQSEALFVEKRFRQHELVLTGRVFPGTRLLELSAWQWIRDGQLYDIHYWCEVCSIRGVDPGLCACCQGDVELREEPSKGKIPPTRTRGP